MRTCRPCCNQSASTAKGSFVSRHWLSPTLRDAPSPAAALLFLEPPPHPLSANPTAPPPLPMMLVDLTSSLLQQQYCVPLTCKHLLGLQALVVPHHFEGLQLGNTAILNPHTISTHYRQQQQQISSSREQRDSCKPGLLTRVLLSIGFLTVSLLKLAVQLWHFFF